MIERKMALEYLHAMGITPWVRRPVAEQTPVSPLVTAAELESVRPAPALDSHAVSGLSMEQLAQRVRQCQACALHSGRTQTVFAVGNTAASWMIIGEAPGAEEDRLGEPFVGRAGKLLNNMLLAVGLQRDQVYIANILKCRPPNNRDPSPEEVRQCMPYLHRQIELVQPKVILAVGRIAAQNLLQRDDPLRRLRGQTCYFGASRIPVVVTYHPAYLLRSPREKAKAWQDLRHARALLVDNTD